MKSATKITDASIAMGALPVIVGIPYAIAWQVRPSEFLNSTFGYPYAAMAILCFIASCILILLALMRRGGVAGRIRVAAIILTANLVLGGWLLLAGPGQVVSVSEVIILNDSQGEIPFVEVSCPYFQTSLRGVPKGEGRQVPVMPKSEGILRVVVSTPDGGTLTQEAVIMEAWAETFRFRVADGDISLLKD